MHVFFFSRDAEGITALTSLSPLQLQVFVVSTEDTLLHGEGNIFMDILAC